MLSASERAMRESWTRRRTTAHALAQGAGIVLACAAGTVNRAVARELRLNEETVPKRRHGSSPSASPGS
jgi:hypothetical protein